MKTKTKKVLSLIICVIIFVISYCVYTFYTLDIGGEPVFSDVIVVTEGDIDRSNKAVKLLNEGYSKSNKIIVSPVIVFDNYDLREWYYEKGLKPKHLMSEYEATSTWTNAVNCINLMEENGFKSAIIVSSDFHMKRTRLAFERAKGNKTFKFYFVSAYHMRDGKEVSYLNDEFLITQGIREVIKYIGYQFHLYYWFDM